MRYGAKELIWSPLISSNACLNQEAEEKMEGDKTWHWNWNWVLFTKREKLDLRKADVQIITFNNLPSFTSQNIFDLVLIEWRGKKVFCDSNGNGQGMWADLKHWRWSARTMDEGVNEGSQWKNNIWKCDVSFGMFCM